MGEKRQWLTRQYWIQLQTNKVYGRTSDHRAMRSVIKESDKTLLSLVKKKSMSSELVAKICPCPLAIQIIYYKCMMIAKKDDI